MYLSRFARSGWSWGLVLVSSLASYRVSANNVTPPYTCQDHKCELERNPLLWFETDSKARAVWAPFGAEAAGSKSFKDWVAAANKESKLPEFRSTLSLNCWEYVLYVSLKLGTLALSEVKSLYAARSKNQSISGLLGSNVGIARYNIHNARVSLVWPAGIKAYDVVFMDNTSHVVQLLGQNDTEGRELVVSFSPRPIWGDGSREHPLPDAQPEVTTIESLIEEMVDLYPDVPSDWKNIELKVVRIEKKEIK